MKKIQAKKKRDRAEAELQAAPESGHVRNILDDDDDTPMLFA